MAEKKETQKQKRLHIELVRQLLTLATAGFGLVAALAWNTFIQEVVNTYIKQWIPGSGIISLFIYALIVTIIAVFVTYQLSSVLQKVDNK
jgi:hypothetical protein